MSDVNESSQVDMTDEEVCIERNQFIAWCQEHGQQPILLPGGFFADPAHQLFFLKSLKDAAELKRCEARNKLRLNEALADIMMREVETGKDALDLMMDTGIVDCFIRLSRAHLKKRDVVNYVELTASLTEDEGEEEEFVITIKRGKGLSPHQLRVEAEGKRDEALQKASQIQQLLHQLYCNWGSGWADFQRAEAEKYISVDQPPSLRDSIQQLRDVVASVTSSASAVGSLPSSALVDLLRIIELGSAGQITPGAELAMKHFGEVIDLISFNLKDDSMADEDVSNKMVNIIKLTREMLTNRLRADVLHEAANSLPA
jgi:hypothetical protein